MSWGPYLGVRGPQSRGGLVRPSPRFTGRECPGPLLPHHWSELPVYSDHPAPCTEEGRRDALWAAPWLALHSQTRGQGIHEALTEEEEDGRREKGAQDLLRQVPPELSFGVPCVLKKKKSSGERCPGRGQDRVLSSSHHQTGAH